MATGIVSIAASLMGDDAVVGLLFPIGQAAYVVLCAFTLVRCAVYPSRLFADFTNPAVAPGFLTTVAGTCILGAQFVTFNGDYDVGFALWVVGFVLWAALLYSLLAALVMNEAETSLKVVNGNWLLAVVATQSVSILGMLLASRLADGRSALVFAALTLFLLGATLYVLIILLIACRLMFLSLGAEELAPSYWINMGAAAITTLAGATLVLHASHTPWLQTIIPFLKGFTLLFWALGTWWIPLMLILGVWRYFYKNFPLRYDAGYWSMVFPLGMYSTCTYQMAKAMEISLLRPVHVLFYYASLLAWVVVFVAFVHEFAATLAKKRFC